MNKFRWVKLRFVMTLVVLAGSLGIRAQPTQAYEFHAPTAVSLPPEAVKTNGVFLVTLSNPVFANGRTNVMALRADVRTAPNTTRKVSRVTFTLERGGRTVYTQQERGAPYCAFGDAFGDQAGACTALQVGDDFPNTSSLIRVGNYTVTVAVFSTAAMPDWQGTVKFVLEPGQIGAERPPYGTGQGNGIFAQVFDGYYASKGTRALRIEVRAQTRQGRPNGGGIAKVQFQVSQRFGDFSDVYSSYELTTPYCIFGEESDGKTCRTLRVGDAWPQSTQIVYDENGKIQGKEPDPGIPPSTIEPGDYTIRIQIEGTDSNDSWNSDDGFVTLLP